MGRRFWGEWELFTCLGLIVFAVSGGSLFVAAGVVGVDGLFTDYRGLLVCKKIFAAKEDAEHAKRRNGAAEGAYW